MGNRSPFEIGQTFGLSDPEVRILYKLACWFNELTFEIHTTDRGQLRPTTSPRFADYVERNAARVGRCTRAANRPWVFQKRKSG